MPNEEIDLVQFGKLTQAVETLTGNVAELTVKVDLLSEQMTGGRGIIAGLMIAAGGVGAGATEVVKKIFSPHA